MGKLLRRAAQAVMTGLVGGAALAVPSAPAASAETACQWVDLETGLTPGNAADYPQEDAYNYIYLELSVVHTGANGCQLAGRPDIQLFGPNSRYNPPNWKLGPVEGRDSPGRLLEPDATVRAGIRFSYDSSESPERDWIPAWAVITLPGTQGRRLVRWPASETMTRDPKANQTTGVMPFRTS